MKLLVSTRKGLVIYSQTNGKWNYESLHFQGIPICLSYYNPLNEMLWAFQDHGHWGIKMSKSNDFGKTWQDVEAPKFPEGAEVKDAQPASLSYVWAAQHVGDTLWLGTVPGGLFKTEDNGETWELNRALWDDPMRKTNWFGGGMRDPGLHSIVVDPRDSKHMHIGISCAGVYETLDCGKSWQVRNKGLRADFLPDPYAEIGHDPHLLVGCPSAPEYLWQQNHCGIFKSVNGAASWDDVTEQGGPAKFGFAVAVDEKNPQRAWVVPGVSDEIRIAVNGALCVCRTDDGGKTWNAFRAGLPQEGSFDIVYRHGLAHFGNQLTFGSTTGNLFHSQDAGESWQVISNYMPMIYAVDYVYV
ncbi:MAG TPA: hypothetical protein VI603_14910 [Saprospiraceae bacterium]|nr:hypothetical protein [Saprospiraceae bacterium]